MDDPKCDLCGEELCRCNEKYNLPCPHNPKILCVQMPASDGEIEEACTECRNDGFYEKE